MTPHATRPIEWREERRRRAWTLKEQGWKQKDIATALGVSQGAVSQWLRRGREGGVEALRHRRALLAAGAEAYGFRGAVWTTARVAAVLARAFGVRYHPAHVCRLLRRRGWSPQRPEVRAGQRDEAAIAAWRTALWPALKKGRGRAAHDHLGR